MHLTETDLIRYVRGAVDGEMRAAQKEAAKREHLKERLSRLVGSIDDEDMTYGDMARYGLEKLNRELPEQDSDPAIAAMEAYLDGRESARADNGMDRRSAFDAAHPRGNSFVDKYIRGEAA